MQSHRWVRYQQRADECRPETPPFCVREHLADAYFYNLFLRYLVDLIGITEVKYSVHLINVIYFGSRSERSVRAKRFRIGITLSFSAFHLNL